MTLISNMRLIGLPSKERGQDWPVLSRQIDRLIEAQGFDLMEETVILDVDGENVTVYRPVIGGVKELGSPWVLTDRSSGQFEVEEVEGQSWEELMRERRGEKFSLFLKRRMGGELRLTVEKVLSFF